MWLLAVKILKELTVDTQDGEKRKDKYLECKNQKKRKTEERNLLGWGSRFVHQTEDQVMWKPWHT